MDRNSNVNQEIKRKFVAREVLTCFSYEMETVLGHSHLATNKNISPLPSYEDIENYDTYRCPQCGHQEKEMLTFESAEYLNQSTNTDEEIPQFKCPNCKKTFDDEPENEPQDILEWWIVTKWMYNELKEQGEPVLEWGNNYYWGRCCSGQAILLDGVIDDICEGMEILDGMAHSWAKKK